MKRRGRILLGALGVVGMALGLVSVTTLSRPWFWWCFGAAAACGFLCVTLSEMADHYARPTDWKIHDGEVTTSTQFHVHWEDR